MNSLLSSTIIQRKLNISQPDETLQAKEISGRTPEVTTDVQAQISSLIGGGQPLAGSVRAFFEPRFGHDFDRVRIHTDQRAAQTARALQARAYTVGRDIVFGTGEYVPGTGAGKRLLAHELAHTVQQSGFGQANIVRRQPPEPLPEPPTVFCVIDPFKLLEARKGDLSAIRQVLDCCLKNIPKLPAACLGDIPSGLCAVIKNDHPFCKTPTQDKNPCREFRDFNKPGTQPHLKGKCCKSLVTKVDCCDPKQIAKPEKKADDEKCCPQGTKPKGNECVKIPGPLLPLKDCENKAPLKMKDPPQCNCPDERHDFINGVCCPVGQVAKGLPLGGCVEKLTCPEGQVVVANKCCPKERATKTECCPEGQVAVGTECCPEQRFNRRTNKCCPEGQVPIGDACVKPAQRILFHKDQPAWSGQSLLESEDEKKGNVLPGTKAALDELAATLQSEPQLRLELAGHASSERPLADTEYNFRLANRRVRLIRDELVKRGIDKSRIGLSSEPLASGCREIDEKTTPLISCGDTQADRPNPNPNDRKVEPRLFQPDAGAALPEQAPTKGLTSTRFKGDPVLEAVSRGERLLKVGDKGSSVAAIQSALMDSGFDLPRFGADGDFGAETQGAVKRFQDSAGLTGDAIDGIVGPITLTLLDKLVST